MSISNIIELPRKGLIPGRAEYKQRDPPVARLALHQAGHLRPDVLVTRTRPVHGLLVTLDLVEDLIGRADEVVDGVDGPDMGHL
jgi:hypothetical protein